MLNTTTLTNLTGLLKVVNTENIETQRTTVKGRARHQDICTTHIVASYRDRSRSCFSSNHNSGDALHRDVILGAVSRQYTTPGTALHQDTILTAVSCQDTLFGTALHRDTTLEKKILIETQLLELLYSKTHISKLFLVEI